MTVKIGVTLDIAPSGSFSKRPHYALRVHYFDAVSYTGALPVPVPHLSDRIEDYLDNIDGLLVPGGGFASPKDWYEEPGADMPYEPSARLQYDLAVIEAALKRDMPVLGICAGMQLMAGLRGCKMTHNVHTRYDTAIDHMNGAPAEEYCHAVHVVSGTLLAEMYGAENAPDVNSAHCEAVVSCPEGVIISATAPDGVIEAIELPQHRFALGVQWHPEFFPGQEPVIPALVKAARQTAGG